VVEVEQQGRQKAQEHLLDVDLDVAETVGGALEQLATRYVLEVVAKDVEGVPRLVEIDEAALPMMR